MWRASGSDALGVGSYAGVGMFRGAGGRWALTRKAREPRAVQKRECGGRRMRVRLVQSREERKVHLDRATHPGALLILHARDSCVRTPTSHGNFRRVVIGCPIDRDAISEGAYCRTIRVKKFASSSLSTCVMVRRGRWMAHRKMDVRRHNDIAANTPFACRFPRRHECLMHVIRCQNRTTIGGANGDEKEEQRCPSVQIPVDGRVLCVC